MAAQIGEGGRHLDLRSTRAARRAGAAPSRRRSRSAMAEIQRNRLLVAAAQAAAELGPSGVSVADVVARAGVSRRTFYELFADRDECIAALLEEAIFRATRRVLPNWKAHASWREAMRAGLASLLAFLDEEPVLGRFLVIDALGAGEQVLHRRAEALDVLIDVVAQGGEGARSPLSVSRLTAEGVVGAVLSIVHARLQSSSVSGLHGQLMAIIVLPYLGSAAAVREARRPLPAASQQALARPDGNPLLGLNIRITYRTVMVLRAAASKPGASNREIARLAGVADQGQISKLLARLVRVGLLESSARDATRGEANAWRLTARGAEVERAVKDRHQ